jgi:hypothetical protein
MPAEGTQQRINTSMATGMCVELHGDGMNSADERSIKPPDARLRET